MSVFLSTPIPEILYKDDYFFVIKDRYPVSPGHCLIISRDVKVDYFDLSESEKHALVLAIDQTKEIILKYYKPDGFNIGMNCGSAAGQTVMHFHCHIIPRYQGDME